jgi:undecaprenyl pyrophosphate synthase
MKAVIDMALFGKDETGSVELKKELLPRHVAIIMDGNGRWAQKRGMPRSFGHKAGVEALREALKEDIDKACLLSLQGTRDYVLSQEKYLDDDTQEAIEWFEIGAPTEGYPKKKEKEEDDEFDFNNLDLSDLMMF